MTPNRVDYNSKKKLKINSRQKLSSTTFRACPEPPGPPHQGPPRTTRTRYEGKGPVPAVYEQGGQQAQEQGREFQHGEGSPIFYFLLQRAAPQFFPSGTQGASCGIWAESGVTFPTLSRSRASSLRRASFSLRRRESSAAKGRSRSTGIGDHA